MLYLKADGKKKYIKDLYIKADGKKKYITKLYVKADGKKKILYEKEATEWASIK